jgi:hypothetical protein
MASENSERIVLEMVIANLVGGLAESRAIPISKLESSLTTPLYRRFRSHQRASEVATDPEKALWERNLEDELLNGTRFSAVSYRPTRRTVAKPSAEATCLLRSSAQSRSALVFKIRTLPKST